MVQAINHRGPDNSGNWVDESDGIGFAHARLSILDLSSAGHQPMHSASKNFVMIFNGEIYNHLALRSELDSINLIEIGMDILTQKHFWLLLKNGV